MSDMMDDDGQVDRTEVARRVRSGIAVVIAFAVLIGGGMFVFGKISEKYHEWRTADDYAGEGAAEVQVVLPPGSSGGKIGAILADNDVVKSSKAFESAFRKEPRSSTIQAGVYKMRTQIPAAKAVEMLLDPANRVIKKVTIPEGLRYTQVAPVLSKATGLPEKDFMDQLNKPTGIGLPAIANNYAEGFLFPATYEVSPNVDAPTMLKTMTTQYGVVSKDMDIANKAKALGRSEYDVLRVASIVEAEVKRDEDRPKVARAIYNRLDAGMPLQVDTAVNYGLNRTGYANLRDGDTKIDTPYNLYLHKGLPPSPINNPGRKSIEAALNPAQGPWKFWVAVNLDTGETKFGTTAAEHEANVKEYQTWCKANPGKCTSS